MMRAGAALFLCVVACYDPSVGNGALRCSPKGECPAGYHCERDLTCWKDGQQPPPTPPGPPRAVQAQAAVRAATVSWFMPVSDGGSPITGYRVSANPPNASMTAPADATSARLVGLSDATTYTFSVVATNAVGDGPPAASAPVTVPGVPAAPQAVSATAGVRSAVVAWHASADNGSPVLGYVVTAAPGGSSTTVPGGETYALVGGLGNASRYVFAVAAQNAVGSGAAASSPPVITPDVPGPPAQVQAMSSSQSITVLWAPPLSNGGATITSYWSTSPRSAGLAS